ncbi:MAG TPA: PqqD family protein [Pyrinomonadaceae bacterium]|nr:PqqD family protein [Pyrinomonadaceae bacterium]
MKVLPRARQASLIIKEVDDETLVYDVEADKAHCLNTTAAQVWKSCDGKTSVEEIATQMSSTDGAPVDESLVWLALDQLEKFKLLDEAPAKPAMLAGLTRRQMVARLGIAAAALPAIVSIVTPHAYAQASLRPPGTCCVNPNDCQSGTCQQEPPGFGPCPYTLNPQQSGKFCQ